MEVPAVRGALRPETRNAARNVRRALDRAREVLPPAPAPATAKPMPPWRLGPSSSPPAEYAVKAALEIFRHDPAAAAACLGWLFTRLPSLGGEGDDMVAHHARLGSERYYEGWGELCRRLRLFRCDP